METQATIKYLQNPATKGWLWKLFDTTGSVVAKATTESATEEDAVANFEAWQAEGGEPVAPAPVVEAPVSPEATAPAVTPEESDGVITKEEINDLNSKTPEGGTEYEIVNKATGEVVPVTGMTFGDGTSTDCVIADTANGPVRFENAAKEGNLVDTDNSNPDYAIRQVGTHLTPNNDGVINNQGAELNPTEGAGSAQ